MKIFQFSLTATLLALLAPSVAIAYPAGTVQLAKDSLFKKGNTQCGFINSKWIPGTLLARSGFFISHTQQAANYRSDANKSSGKRKKKLLSQATSYSRKAKALNAFCKSGPDYKYNISGATTLAILPASSTNKLYKISASGTLDVVTRTIIGGALIPITDKPVAVYPVGEKYFIALFGLDDLNIFDGYLVRRSDGRIFSLRSVGFPSTYPTNTAYKNAQVVQLDQDGNAYYKVAEIGSQGYNEFKVVKLNFSKPTDIIATTILPIDESIYNFIVDPAGNIIFDSYLRSDTSIHYFRIKTAAGSIANIPQDSVYWKGRDNYFYYQASSGGLQTKRIEVDGSGNVTTTDYGDNLVSIPSIYLSYRFDFATRVIFASSDTGGVVEANNAANTPRTVAGLPLTNVRAGVQSSSHYFLAGNNGAAQPCLIKVNPVDDSFTHLYTPGKYDVYRLAVSVNGIVTISALRLSDGKKILVEISSDGTETVVDASLDVAAEQLLSLR